MIALCRAFDIPSVERVIEEVDDMLDVTRSSGVATLPTPEDEVFAGVKQVVDRLNGLVNAAHGPGNSLSAR